MLDRQYPQGKLPTKCTASELEAGNYSCTTDSLGVSLDSLLEQYVDYWYGRNANFGLLQEGYVSAIMWNTTGEEVLTKEAIWAPNRQVLWELAKDRAIVALNSEQESQQVLSHQHNIESYGIFNRSLEMRIQRNGPMVRKT